MPLTHYALDTFVSQEMSKLTACAPQSLATEFPERSHWINQFVLRRILHNHVSDEGVALAYILVRRVEAAIDEWELACSAAGDVRHPWGYFKMLRHLENCVAALWQGFEFCRHALGTKLFEKGDGSVYERLNWLYNVSRHFNPNELASGDLHRLWISNEGLNSREHTLTFLELREAISFLAKLVEKFVGRSPETNA
jgi:hypothetical protein